MKKTILLVLLLSMCSITPQEKSRKTYFVESADASIPVFYLGPDTKKIILFVHGGPALSSVYYYYMAFFQRLAQHYKIFFWDQRGSGGSRGAITKESITIPQFVEDMDVVYTSIKVLYPNSDIYVMGHSYGGLVGGAYSSFYNDKVAASIFVSPAFNIEEINKMISSIMIDCIGQILTMSLTTKNKKYWEDAKSFYQKNPLIGASTYIQHSKYVSAIGAIKGLGHMFSYIKENADNFFADGILEDFNVFTHMSQILKALEANGEEQRDLSTDPDFGLAKITHPVFMSTAELDLMVPASTSIDGYNHLNGGVPNPASERISYAFASHNAFLQSVQDDLFDKITNFIYNN